MTGALIVGSIYVLFGFRLDDIITIHPAAKQIVGLMSFMPQLLIAAFCYFVGSLYITGLEGAVDWLHHKMASTDVVALRPGPKRWFLRFIAPLSDSARSRIKVQGARFYRHYMNWSSDDTNSQEKEIRSQEEEAQFVQKVIAEILWMEGKLVGSPLLAPYEQYRAEGEIRLGSALILPFVAAAVAFALGAQGLGVWTTALASVPVALKFADYGLYYYRRAHSFLAHHVSDGTVLTPSMEDLKRASPMQCLVPTDNFPKR